VFIVKITEFQNNLKIYFIFVDYNMNKKQYIKPEINLINLDNSISLVMMTIPPKPPPRAGGNKGVEPLSSPFGNKPFG